jgi:hypothetical protein
MFTIDASIVAISTPMATIANVVHGLCDRSLEFTAPHYRTVRRGAGDEA